jgi:glycosyltransferase involved in cell wall biosynthesis
VPALSVVLPTHQRASLLRQALRHLAQQTCAQELEVIVISDGPDPDTEALFATPPALPFPLQTRIIPKSHQGVARNRGVDLATAPFVLFIQDDIFLEPDACAQHLATHQAQGETAVLGFTTWDPACGITPVMRWLEATGWQFGYSHLAAYAGRALPIDLQHRYTYTSHLSLPTELARFVRFREDVRLYGWEDVEWGQRLRDACLSLTYQPAARALHHHHLDLSDSLKRMETLGRAARHFETLVPDLRITPRGWKWCAYHMLSLTPTLRGQHAQAWLRGLKTR